MTNEEVIKAVMSEMYNRCKKSCEELTTEYRRGISKGLPFHELFDIKDERHDAFTRLHTIGEIIETLDDRCSAYVNGIEYL